MEFATPFDQTKEIHTWRRAEKWCERITPGSVIEISKVHQQTPWRGFAVIVSIDDEPPPANQVERLHQIYKGAALVHVVLLCEPGLDRTHPRYVTWETKTTKLLKG